jgi:hypothetical protein
MSTSKPEKKSKQKGSKAPATVSWTRILADGVSTNMDEEGGGISSAAELTAALTREVNVDHVQELLRERWEAKQTKNYEVADQNAAALRMMRVAYHDNNMTWNTLPLATLKRSLDISSASKKRTKKQERNRRQALKNRKKQAGSDGSGSEGSGGEEAEEEEPKMTKKKRVV